MSYRRNLWANSPPSRISGVSVRARCGGWKRWECTMGDIAARCSLGKSGDYYNEELLLPKRSVCRRSLLDHAWGWDVYDRGHPRLPAGLQQHQLRAGAAGAVRLAQAKLIVREMTDLLVLDLVKKSACVPISSHSRSGTTSKISPTRPRRRYAGETHVDRYGRRVPKHGHGTANLAGYSSSTREITDAVMALYDRITDKNLLVRRVTVAANRVLPENKIPHAAESGEQMDLFSAAEEKPCHPARSRRRERERRWQEAILAIQRRYGSNAILKGMNLEEGATTRERNKQIGGHRA